MYVSLCACWQITIPGRRRILGSDVRLAGEVDTAAMLMMKTLNNQTNTNKQAHTNKQTKHTKNTPSAQTHVTIPSQHAGIRARPAKLVDHRPRHQQSAQQYAEDVARLSVTFED